MRPESGSYTPPRWLAPGVALMQRFGMSVKLACISALLLIPLSVVTFVQVADQVQVYRLVELEGLGVQGASLLIDMVAEVQRHRTDVLMSADPARESERAQNRKRLDAALAALDRWIKQNPELDLGTLWGETRSDIGALSHELAGKDSAAVFAQHAKVVDGLRKLTLYVGETSKLVLDSEGDSYFLQDVLTAQAVPWLDATSHLQAVGAAWVGQLPDKDAQVAALATIADLTDERTWVVREKLLAHPRAGGTASFKNDEALAATQALTRAARGEFGKNPTPESASAFVTLAGAALQAGETMRRKLASLLQDRLDQRQSAALRQALLLGGFASAGALGVFYLMLAFSVATVSSLNVLHLALKEGTKGNLAVKVKAHGTDELASISHEFEAMLGVLSALVADVRSASSMVTHVGGQLVDDGQQLSQRTQAQASSLEEATTSVGDVSETVARNSESAQEVSMMTKGLHQEAENASVLMGKTMDGMGELQTTSNRMTEIIGTIDGIAFQTNLLALNAAVEAARAGEQGKGFAVVAAEVRSLARRSQVAAGEVRSMIADSASRVGNTVKAIEGVSQLMGSLVTGIREIAINVDTMAEGSVKQSIALAEVVQAVGDLDRVTIENSGLVDRTSHRSARLMQRSKQLEDAVTHIRLRQGTTDEAMAIAIKAHALVQSIGLEAATPIFHDPQGGFVDRDLYVFVFDRQGVYRVIGADTARVGTSLSDVPGLDAQQLLDDAWERCALGGGWVEYTIINPLTKDVRSKASYILQIDDQQLIGCGAYRGTAL